MMFIALSISEGAIPYVAFALFALPLLLIVAIIAGAQIGKAHFHLQTAVKMIDTGQYADARAQILSAVRLNPRLKKIVELQVIYDELVDDRSLRSDINIPPTLRALSATSLPHWQRICLVFGEIPWMKIALGALVLKALLNLFHI